MSDDPIDERDATIERLELALANERQHSAQLRKTIDELRFKVSVLEKSYAKQLADARSRSGAAEQRLADHQARLASLDSDRAETARTLNETRAELERVTADTTRSRAQPPRTQPPRKGSERKPSPYLRDSSTPQLQSGEHTINDLMATSTWLSSLQPETDASARPHTAAAPAPMLAPELVFPDGYDKDDKT